MFYCVVSKVTRLQVVQPKKIMIQLLAEARDSFLLQSVQTSSMIHAASYLTGTVGSFPEYRM